MGRGFLFVLGTFLIVTTASHATSKMAYMLEVKDAKHIVVSNADGTSPVTITKDSLWHLYPDLDAAGKRIAYVEGTAFDKLGIVVQDLETGAKTAITPVEGSHLHPDFSGDGRFLAFSGNYGPSGRAAIAVVDLTAEKPKPEVVPSDLPSYFPSLSSDAGFVVFQRSKSEKERDVVLYDFASKKTTVLSDPNAVSMAPSLSFDDERVAYTSQVDNNWDVYIVDKKGGNRVRVTSHASRDFAPTFRPDGSLVFASDREGHFQLYEISSKDILEKKLGGEKLLVKGEGDYYAPSVSGDSSIKQALLAPMVAPSRSSFGAARLGDRLYVVGGHQGHEHTYPPESFVGNMEYFDLKTKTWHKAPPRPEPCHGFGIAAHGKYLYAFGGFAYSDKHEPKWKSLDSIDRFDVEKNEWTRVAAKLAKPRSSNVVAQLGDKVYLIAGWDSTPKKPKDFEGEFLRTIEVFDLATEKVTVSDVKLPDPLRRALTGVVSGDEILLVGGLGQGASHFDLLDKVTAWNPSTGKWRELPRLPFATFAPAAGVIGDELFVFGGMFKTGQMEYAYVNHVFKHDSKVGIWQHTGRFLHETKGFSQVVPIGPRSLGILGGHAYFADTDSPVLTFEEFTK